MCIHSFKRFEKSVTVIYFKGKSVAPLRGLLQDKSLENVPYLSYTCQAYSSSSVILKFFFQANFISCS